MQAPTVLIVDHDDAQREEIRRTLEAAGLRVELGATIAESLRGARERPDLVLLNIDLPDGERCELCQRVQEALGTAATPVLHTSQSRAAVDQPSTLNSTSMLGSASGLTFGSASGLTFGSTSGLTFGATFDCCRAGSRAWPIESRLLVTTVRALLSARAASIARAESDERFLATFDQAAVGMAHVSLDDRLLRVNPKLCELLGYTLGEMMALRAQDLRHPDHAEGALRHVHALGDGKIASSTAEERCVRRDGSMLWVAVTRSLARDRAGAPLYIVEVVNEIERRKRAEEARERALASERVARIRAELAEARIARLQTFTSELSRAVTPQEVAEVVLSLGLAALHADAGYVALLAEDDMIDVLRAPGYPEDMLDLLRRIPMSARLPVVDCIRAGQLLIFDSLEALHAAYPDAPNSAWAKTRICIPLTLRDVTFGVLGVTYVEACRISEDDRRFMTTLALQCAQALERARLYEAEQRARRLREEALAIAAHDLRNPLSSIMLAASLLERSAPADAAGQPIRGRAQQIKRAAERTIAMLGELLDAAIIEAKGLKLDIQPCEVGSLVNEVVEMLAPLAEQKQIRLRPVLPESALRLSCDRGRMLQVLSNLVGNALKFTSEGREITIGAELHGAGVRLSVSDTGMGIRPEDLPRLFDRYWQARATRCTGAGLGLYIVKGIVEAHGGQMSVDSELGEGTTFSCTIPAARETRGG
ncbi:ATP-binding protein [Sorangium sp. So ce375]|uniref:ATP-binding protein n=1 Tax=Sorangium sp. So ce375 TaxID=3133306 RepID=UPI003F5C55E2